MKSKTLRIVNYLLAAFNLLVVLILYAKLPAQIPMSWDFGGTITAMEDKWQIFLLSGMALILAMLFDLLPHMDPRKKNYDKFSGFYDRFCIFMQLFMLLCTAIVLTEGLRPGTFQIPKVLLLTIAVLFLFLGNALPKVKSNFFIGIRTPWALSNEENWRKTQRLAGKCFFSAGLLLLPAIWIKNQWIMAAVLFILLFAACLIPSIMSYLWYRKELH